jgi:hypothetical protein
VGVHGIYIHKINTCGGVCCGDGRASGSSFSGFFSTLYAKSSSSSGALCLHFQPIGMRACLWFRVPQKHGEGGREVGWIHLKPTYPTL